MLRFQVTLSLNKYTNNIVLLVKILGWPHCLILGPLYFLLFPFIIIKIQLYIASILMTSTHHILTNNPTIVLKFLLYSIPQKFNLSYWYIPKVFFSCMKKIVLNSVITLYVLWTYCAYSITPNEIYNYQ